jgi:hypothetical protein
MTNLQWHLMNLDLERNALLQVTGETALQDRIQCANYPCCWEQILHCKECEKASLAIHGSWECGSYGRHEICLLGLHCKPQTLRVY